MKKTLTLLVMFFGFVAAFAQTAPTFPYQAVVRNSQNQLMRDTTITIDVTVKQAGVVKYHEICPDVPTNHNGMLSFIIGAPADPTYAEHSLSDVTDWSKVSFTFVYSLSDGDVTVTDSIRPVPYALQSADSPSLTNLENRVNTFNTHVCDSVAACLDGANNALSQQIVRIVGDTLSNGNSVLNHTVDTIVENHISTLEGELCTKVMDCTDIKTMRDSIQTNNTNISSLRTHVNDTLSSYYTKSKINDTLSSYFTKSEVRTEIKDTANVLRGLISTAAGNITALKDSVEHNFVSNNDLCTKVMNCPDIKTMRDSIQSNAADIATNAGNISTNTTNISDLQSHTTKDALRDSVAEQIYDTLAAHKVVVVFNGIAIDSFKLNDAARIPVNVNVKDTTQRFIATEGQTDFTLMYVPLDHFSVMFYVNGVFICDLLEGSVSAISQDTTDKKKVTYDAAKNGNYALVAGDRIQIVYSHR